ncbi:TolC family protein [Reichenbachiella sp. MALMAid0571]|uniref:TolC family protein n=1 Tax=Reichenbachiella sp. MALMAid0571 TaxID=3143939 RepID=UPI0032DE92D2
MKNLLLIYLLALTFRLSAQTLEDYQQIALKDNPALQAKYKEFEAALTRIEQVNSLPDPTLSFGYFISPVETRVGPQKVRFSMTQMFPWFGTLKAQGNVEAMKAEVIYQQLVDMQNKLRFEISKSYYPLAELQQLLDVQVANIELLNSWKNLASSKFENGKISLTDLLRIDILINELETEWQILESKRKPLSIALNRLLNRPDSTKIHIESLDNKKRLNTRVNDLNNHPRISELYKRIETAELQNKAIEKQSLPKIGAGLDYFLIGKRSDMNVAENGKNAFMPTITLSLPVFRKKYSVAIMENKLKIDADKLNILAVQNELLSAIANLEYEAEREFKLLGLYEDQITEMKKIQDLLLISFSNSSEDLDELLRTQMQILNYEEKKIKAQTRLNTLAENLNYVQASDSN